MPNRDWVAGRFSDKACNGATRKTPEASLHALATSCLAASSSVPIAVMSAASSSGSVSSPIALRTAEGALMPKRRKISSILECGLASWKPNHQA